MTLGDFFQAVSDNPTPTIFFFLAIPLTAFLVDVFGKDEGHLSPWKYVYSALIYLACIPGIFAITLSAYVFIFERQSIFDTSIFTQILPIISMMATLIIIRKNVDLNKVPGFDRLSGLITILFVIMGLLWILDKTHIIAITFIPFHIFALVFVVGLILIRICWSSLFKKL